MDTKQGMVILLVLAVLLMLFVASLSYRKRHLPGAKTLIAIMIGAVLYASGYVLELLSSDLNTFKLSLQIEYLGIPFVSTLWLLQAIQFTGTAAKLGRSMMSALFIIPVVIFFLHLTNDWHHLIYEQYIWHSDTSIPLYTTVKGFGYKVHTAYNYAVMLCGIMLYLSMYWRSMANVRKQIAVLLIGAAAPFLFNMFFWTGINVDLTPFGFAVSGVVYLWGIYRINLLRLTPLAMAKVFDTIRDGAILLDYEDQIVSFNKAAGEVLPELGLAKQLPIPAVQVLSDCPELLTSVIAATSEEERFSFQRFMLNRNRHYDCRLSFIYDTSTLPIGKILLFTDITEMKENEARLRENARQLSELNAFKDKLFTVVTHDIRDPIAILVSLTELLGEELTEADMEHAELFRELKGQMQNTFHLVENLLDWYRSQRGKVVFRPSGWNLQQVVRQALSMVSTKAGMKQIRMTERIDERLTVRADKEMLDLILRNLLSNAIKYTGVGEFIELEAVLEGELVVVSVRDNGVGMDKKTTELLLMEEPLLGPLDQEDERGAMRFGLVLTREFVRINGGSLWFSTEAGKGTTFSFTLPGSLGGREAFDSEGREAELYESYTG